MVALLSNGSPIDRVVLAHFPSLGDSQMTTTYHGGEQIEHAQAVLDRHAVSSSDGLCATCRVLGPCAEHETATRVFMLSARLPQRRPGATRPELTGAKGADFRWLPQQLG